MLIPSDRPRVVSPTVHVQPRVTSLVELSCRILFSYHDFPNSDPFAELNDTSILPGETVLSRHELPLGYKISWAMPQPIREILNLCVPGSVEMPEQNLAAGHALGDDITGISVCPSPHHHNKSVFVKHAEERFTWEESVAGVNVGGAVPVRWRGCQWGCMDFLNEGMEEDRRGSAVGDLDMASEEDEMGVVQLVEFTPEEYADFI